MKIVFNELRAAQAAAHLLKLNDGQMSGFVLLKMMYLADKASILEVGKPITGDRMIAMKDGPTLSACLNCVRLGGEIWSKFIPPRERGKYNVRLVEDPGNGKLSIYETDVLTEAYREVERIVGREAIIGDLPWSDYRKISDHFHAFPEWEVPEGGLQGPIEPETILKNANVSDEEIEEHRAHAEIRADLGQS